MLEEEVVWNSLMTGWVSSSASLEMFVIETLDRGVLTFRVGMNGVLARGGVFTFVVVVGVDDCEVGTGMKEANEDIDDDDDNF